MHVSAKDLSMARGAGGVRVERVTGRQQCVAISISLTHDTWPGAIGRAINQANDATMATTPCSTRHPRHKGNLALKKGKRVSNFGSLLCSAPSFPLCHHVSQPQFKSKAEPNQTEPKWTVLKHIEGRTPRLMWWLPVSVIPFETACSGRVREWKLALRSPVASLFHLSCDWLDNWLFE